MNKSKLTPQELEELAYLYIDECIDNRKEVVASSGKIVLIRDRHLPTISFFLRIWIPRKNKLTINRGTYYNWLNKEEQTDEHNSIKNIDELFKAVAIDILANEGGAGRIFYSKNKLGYTDKFPTITSNVEQPLFPIVAEFGKIIGMEIK